MKNSFVFYTEWIEQIRLLEKHGTQKDLDAFWDALRAFVEDGEGDPETAMAEITFLPLRNQIARDTAKYDEKSRKRKEAIKKRWQGDTKGYKEIQTDTNGYKQIQTDTNDTDDEDVDVDDDVDVSTNVDDIHTVSERELRDEFELIWAKYPRKVGKKDAFRHYKAARKKGAVFDEVYNGVMKYADAMAAEDEQYIAQGSTWFNGHRWEDEDVHARARPQKHLTMAEISSLPIIDPFAELRGAT